ALGEALAASAQIAAAAARHATPSSLWSAVIAPPPPHPTGLPAGSAGSCGTCAWRHQQRGTARCRQAAAKIDDAWPGCERYEAALDCQTCGACCRAAYHLVEIKRRDPVVKARPEYVVDHGTYLAIRRDGDRCAALHGGHPDGDRLTRYSCVI